MLATEISAAKRERDFYMSRVAKAKATAAQKERKLKVCALSSNQCITQHAHQQQGQTSNAMQTHEMREELLVLVWANLLFNICHKAYLT